MSVIPPIGPVAANPIKSIRTETAAPGFSESIGKALESVSALEHETDQVAEAIATGGDASIQELMVASAKATLGVELLVQVRNRALEAYQEIMRMQV